MLRVLVLGLLAFSSCTVAPGPSSPQEDVVEAEAPKAPEPEPEPEPEAPSSPPKVDASALSVPHDVPPLDTPCETRRSFAVGELEHAVEFAAAGCSVDADCVRAASGTGCRGGCPTAILATHEAAYETFRSSIDERVCSTYRKDGCPYATPRCAGGAVRCVEGTCSFGPG